MKEQSVQPIGGVRASESGVSIKVQASDRADTFLSREHAVPDVERSAKQTEAEKTTAKHLTNISIHFSIDEQTNHVIVIVTDRQTGSVLRTIPASEFEKLHAGDLLKLTA